MATYSHTIKLVEGDTLPELFIKLKDANAGEPNANNYDPENPNTWATIMLTGASVKLKIRKQGSTTLKTEIDCDVWDAVNGQILVAFPDGTWDEGGTFEGEVEVTFSTGGKQTVHSLIKFKVRGDF